MVSLHIGKRSVELEREIVSAGNPGGRRRFVPECGLALLTEALML